MVKPRAETAPLLKPISRGTSRAPGQVLVKHLPSAGSLKFSVTCTRSSQALRPSTGPREGPRRHSVNAWMSLHSQQFEWPPGGVLGGRARLVLAQIDRFVPEQIGGRDLERLERGAQGFLLSYGGDSMAKPVTVWVWQLPI